MYTSAHLCKPPNRRFTEVSGGLRGRTTVPTPFGAPMSQPHLWRGRQQHASSRSRSSRSRSRSRPAGAGQQEQQEQQEQPEQQETQQLQQESASSRRPAAGGQQLEASRRQASYRRPAAAFQLRKACYNPALYYDFNSFRTSLAPPGALRRGAQACFTN